MPAVISPYCAPCCRIPVLMLLMLNAGCTASFVRVQTSTHDGGIKWGSGVSFGGDIEMKDEDENGKEEDLHIHNNVITEDVQASLRFLECNFKSALSASGRC